MVMFSETASTAPLVGYYSFTLVLQLFPKQDSMLFLQINNGALLKNPEINLVDFLCKRSHSS